MVLSCFEVGMEYFKKVTPILGGYRFAMPSKSNILPGTKQITLATVVM